MMSQNWMLDCMMSCSTAEWTKRRTKRWSGVGEPGGHSRRK